jgi:uncharacterized membrane protein YeaQ/YmgE (transglycosylase-associated protein family)
MSIIAFIILGVVAGFLARAIMPGKQGMGIVMTGLLGIAGSFVGGFGASLITGQPVLQLQASGLIGSVIGALVILAIVGVVGRRHATA